MQWRKFVGKFDVRILRNFWRTSESIERKKTSRSFVINFKVMFISWFIHCHTRDQRPPALNTLTCSFCCQPPTRNSQISLMSFLHVPCSREKLLSQRDCSIFSKLQITQSPRVKLSYQTTLETSKFSMLLFFLYLFDVVHSSCFFV